MGRGGGEGGAAHETNDPIGHKAAERQVRMHSTEAHSNKVPLTTA